MFSKVLLVSPIMTHSYGVETKGINQVIRRNPDKFPEGYIITLEADNWEILRSQFVTLSGNGWGQHTKYL